MLRECASRSAQVPAPLNVDAIKKKIATSSSPSHAHNLRQRFNNAVRGNCWHSTHDQKAVRNFCKKQGHFAEDCRAKKRRKLASVDLCTVHMQRARDIEVSVNDHMTMFKVDSGADVIVVPSSFPGIPRKFDAVEGELLGPGSLPLSVLGTFKAILARWDNYTVPRATHNRSSGHC